MTRVLAIELGRADLQVNAILPGYIETDMSRDPSQAFRDACVRRSALGKIVTMADMEGLAVYLASRESSFMTGQALISMAGKRSTRAELPAHLPGCPGVAWCISRPAAQRRWKPCQYLRSFGPATVPLSCSPIDVGHSPSSELTVGTSR